MPLTPDMITAITKGNQDAVEAYAKTNLTDLLDVGLDGSSGFSMMVLNGNLNLMQIVIDQVFAQKKSENEESENEKRLKIHFTGNTEFISPLLFRLLATLPTNSTVSTSASTTATTTSTKKDIPGCLALLVTTAKTKLGLNDYINTQDAKSGETPLHLAAKLGSAETMQVLFKLGASPAIRTKEGLLAFHLAPPSSAEACTKVFTDHCYSKQDDPDTTKVRKYFDDRYFNGRTDEKYTISDIATKIFAIDYYAGNPNQQLEAIRKILAELASIKDFQSQFARVLLHALSNAIHYGNATKVVSRESKSLSRLSAASVSSLTSTARKATTSSETTSSENKDSKDQKTDSIPDSTTLFAALSEAKEILHTLKLWNLEEAKAAPAAETKSKDSKETKEKPKSDAETKQETQILTSSTPQNDLEERRKTKELAIAKNFMAATVLLCQLSCNPKNENSEQISKLLWNQYLADFQVIPSLATAFIGQMEPLKAVQQIFAGLIFDQSYSENYLYHALECVAYERLPLAPPSLKPQTSNNTSTSKTQPSTDNKEGKSESKGPVTTHATNTEEESETKKLLSRMHAAQQILIRVGVWKTEIKDSKADSSKTKISEKDKRTIRWFSAANILILQIVMQEEDAQLNERSINRMKEIVMGLADRLSRDKQHPELICHLLQQITPILPTKNEFEYFQSLAKALVALELVNFQKLGPFGRAGSSRSTTDMNSFFTKAGEAKDIPTLQKVIDDFSMLESSQQLKKTLAIHSKAKTTKQQQERAATTHLHEVTKLGDAGAIDRLLLGSMPIRADQKNGMGLMAIQLLPYVNDSVKAFQCYKAYFDFCFNFGLKTAGSEDVRIYFKQRYFNQDIIKLICSSEGHIDEKEFTGEMREHIFRIEYLTGNANDPAAQRAAVDYILVLLSNTDSETFKKILQHALKHAVNYETLTTAPKLAVTQQAARKTTTTSTAITSSSQERKSEVKETTAPNVSEQKDSKNQNISDNQKQAQKLDLTSPLYVALQQAKQNLQAAGLWVFNFDSEAKDANENQQKLDVTKTYMAATVLTCQSSMTQDHYNQLWKVYIPELFKSNHSTLAYNIIRRLDPVASIHNIFALIRVSSESEIEPSLIYALSDAIPYQSIDFSTRTSQRQLTLMSTVNISSTSETKQAQQSSTEGQPQTSMSGDTSDSKEHKEQKSDPLFYVLKDARAFLTREGLWPETTEVKDSKTEQKKTDNTEAINIYMAAAVLCHKIKATEAKRDSIPIHEDKTVAMKKEVTLFARHLEKHPTLVLHILEQFTPLSDFTQQKDYFYTAAIALGEIASQAFAKLSWTDNWGSNIGKKIEKIMARIKDSHKTKSEVQLIISQALSESGSTGILKDFKDGLSFFLKRTFDRPESWENAKQALPQYMLKPYDLTERARPKSFLLETENKQLLGCHEIGQGSEICYIMGPGSFYTNDLNKTGLGKTYRFITCDDDTWTREYNRDPKIEIKPRTTPSREECLAREHAIVTALAKKYGKKIAVMGFSAPGCIALAYTAKHPEQVARLHLCGVPLAGVDKEFKQSDEVFAQQAPASFAFYMAAGANYKAVMEGGGKALPSTHLVEIQDTKAVASNNSPQVQLAGAGESKGTDDKDNKTATVALKVRRPSINSAWTLGLTSLFFKAFSSARLTAETWQTYHNHWLSNSVGRVIHPGARDAFFKKSLSEFTPMEDLETLRESNKVPLQILQGNQDFVTYLPEDFAEYLRTNFKDFVEYEGCGHHPYIEVPKEFCSAVTNFANHTKTEQKQELPKMKIQLQQPQQSQQPGSSSSQQPGQASTSTATSATDVSASVSVSVSATSTATESASLTESASSAATKSSSAEVSEPPRAVA